MKTYAFIFVRAGSKGLPGKNVRELSGKTLLARAIELAYEIDEISKVFVSTDCSKAQRIAHECGAIVIWRPAELATDEAPEWLAWQHAVENTISIYGPFDRFLSLPATAPLRQTDDVIRCLHSLDDATDVVVTMTPSHRNPWFNMVTADDQQVIQLVNKGQNFFRRQDAPETFDLTTVAYVSTPMFILEKSRIWDGRVRGVIVSSENAIDIDVESDFKLAEYLMEERQGGK